MKGEKKKKKKLKTSRRNCVHRILNWTSFIHLRDPLNRKIKVLTFLMQNIFTNLKMYLRASDLKR